MSRWALTAALVTALLIGGCGDEEVSKLPLGESVVLPVSGMNGGGGSIVITPKAIWRGTPDDLIGLNVRHNNGTDEPAPSGMPYYVPMTFENNTNGSMLMGAVHTFVLAVDTKDKSVAPLDDPQWQPGKSPCEGFAFRDGLRQSGAVDLCQVFALPLRAKLDYLRTVKSGGKQFAWAVPRDIATARPDR